MSQTSLFKAAWKKEMKEQAKPKGVRQTLMLLRGRETRK
jgi:hypothetical protein